MHTSCLNQSHEHMAPLARPDGEAANIDANMRKASRGATPRGHARSLLSADNSPRLQRYRFDCRRRAAVSSLHPPACPAQLLLESLATGSLFSTARPGWTLAPGSIGSTSNSSIGSSSSQRMVRGQRPRCNPDGGVANCVRGGLGSPRSCQMLVSLTLAA